MLDKHVIAMEERPARRHKKVGVVESRHDALRLFTHCLLKDAEYYRATQGLVTSDEAILSKATFLCNALPGHATLSSFELARGYAPSFVGLPQTETSKELLKAHYEQQSKRA